MNALQLNSLIQAVIDLRHAAEASTSTGRYALDEAIGAIEEDPEPAVRALAREARGILPSITVGYDLEGVAGRCGRVLDIAKAGKTPSGSFCDDCLQKVGSKVDDSSRWR